MVSDPASRNNTVSTIAGFSAAVGTAAGDAGTAIVTGPGEASGGDARAGVTGVGDPVNVGPAAGDGTDATWTGGAG